MISIVICARKEDIPEELRSNIAATIGLPYEIIVIDNSENRYTIFTAYNEGVSRARFPLVLFMHDDILHHTENWGQRVVRHFEDPKVGAIGVAGTPYLPFTTGGWWSAGMGHMRLLQSGIDPVGPKLEDYFPAGAETSDVVILDGVWFCIRRSLFTSIRFDSATFHGFHFYDVDTTLQVFLLGYRVVVIRDVLIHHLSIGSLNEQWVDNARIFHRKWKKHLPLQTLPYTRQEQCHMEYRVVNELMETRLKIGKLPPRQVVGDALRSLFEFSPNRRYFKTPVWAARLFRRWLQGS